MLHAAVIEAELSFRGIDIADWHQGTVDSHGRPKLSSRRLMVLCEHIPEIGGRWPRSLQLLKEVHTEVALNRAAKYVGGPNEYVPQLFLDPAEARKLMDKKQETDDFIEDSTEELFDDLGFT